jgi:hypothetical protein
MAASMKIPIFFVVALFILVEVYQYFRGPCCLCHHPDAWFKVNLDTRIVYNACIEWFLMWQVIALFSKLCYSQQQTATK